MRVIIIGGGAAGASCATRLRRVNERKNAFKRYLKGV